MRRKLFALPAGVSAAVCVAVMLTDPSAAVHRVLEALFLAVGFTMIAVVISFRREWDREQRVKRGLCPGCGYDLRGSLDRCPECGSVPATQEKIAGVAGGEKPPRDTD